MGMQSAAVRNLNVGGIFTTAATATFIFLFGAVANGVSLTGDERRRMRVCLFHLLSAQQSAASPHSCADLRSCAPVRHHYRSRRDSGESLSDVTTKRMSLKQRPTGRLMLR